jgi:hypothetical protein
MAFQHKIDQMNRRLDIMADRLQDVLEHLGLEEPTQLPARQRPTPKAPEPKPHPEK